MDFVYSGGDFCKFVDGEICKFKVRPIGSDRTDNAVLFDQLTDRFLICSVVEVEPDYAKSPERSVLAQHITKLLGCVSPPGGDRAFEIYKLNGNPSRVGQHVVNEVILRIALYVPANGTARKQTKAVGDIGFAPELVVEWTLRPKGARAATRHPAPNGLILLKPLRRVSIFKSPPNNLSDVPKP
jgi:hypothetical protein